VEKAYNALLIERNNTQAKYNDLMAKYMESQVAHGLEKEQKGERFTMIDPARFPERPVKPNRMAIVLIGFVLAVGGGVGLPPSGSSRTIRSATPAAWAGPPLPRPRRHPPDRDQGRHRAEEMKKAALSLGLVVLIAGGLLCLPQPGHGPRHPVDQDQHEAAFVRVKTSSKLIGAALLL
jgi:hypothetical protein